MEDDSVSPIKCAKCGRMLHLERSIDRGLGPVCYRNLQYWAALTGIPDDQPILIPAF